MWKSYSKTIIALSFIWAKFEQSFWGFPYLLPSHQLTLLKEMCVKSAYSSILSAAAAPDVMNGLSYIDTV